MKSTMINPSVVDLLTKVEDRYSLVIVTSKRARQIIDGSAQRIEIDSKKPLTIAINEVNEGLVGFERPEENVEDNE
ncbi:DNA-directed RNA polymerase subunit omega [uncultured Clostridium sp.]|uniref:DNA-directed RNA polymerase subunit omega n=1 Tax=uncultured Clostridium sp. TaxID=59620 RepID=UPI0025D85BB9|nr:DNA-directed RNA polymerase subunit omega [uncultured Clostridium sp.]